MWNCLVDDIYAVWILALKCAGGAPQVTSIATNTNLLPELCMLRTTCIIPTHKGEAND